MIKELNKIFDITGGKIKLVLLLVSRCPFDAVWNLAHALFMKYSFNSILTGNTGILSRACLIFALSSLALFLYNGVVWTIFSTFNVKKEGVLRLKLFYWITELPLSRVHTFTKGEWATRLNTDVVLPNNKVLNLPHASVAAVNIILSSIILILMNKSIFALIAVFVIPHIIISIILSSRSIPKHKTKSLNALSNNTNDLTTIIECMEIAHIYDSKDYLLNRFEVSSKQIRKSNMKIHNITSFNNSIKKILDLLGFFVLLLVSAGWIARGNFTFGDLSAVLQFRFGMVKGSRMLASCILNMKVCTPSLKRVNEVFSFDKEE